MLLLIVILLAVIAATMLMGPAGGLGVLLAVAVIAGMVAAVGGGFTLWALWELMGPYVMGAAGIGAGFFALALLWELVRPKPVPLLPPRAPKPPPPFDLERALDGAAPLNDHAVEGLKRERSRLRRRVAELEREPAAAAAAEAAAAAAMLERIDRRLTGEAGQDSSRR